MEEFRWKSDKDRIQREQDAITKPELTKREAERKLAEQKKGDAFNGKQR
jgi:hypothetical protein